LYAFTSTIWKFISMYFIFEATLNFKIFFLLLLVLVINQACWGVIETQWTVLVGVFLDQFWLYTDTEETITKVSVITPITVQWRCRGVHHCVCVSTDRFHPLALSLDLICPICSLFLFLSFRFFIRLIFKNTSLLPL
jgi:hypothetical protein